MRLDNFGDRFFCDTPRGMIRRAILGNCRPVVGLEHVEVSCRSFGRLTSRRAICASPTHMVNKRIGENIVIG